ncbi:MAG TPA: CaiB/BaiF CoA-transferase family protein [Candidatus Lustribacter sp.]|nr:CaiB/BaiF CoA-transferase family protein [Candidatus Lustribacter sp.]
MSAPLDGITVLDLSRVVAGPWATMALGDLGADIWKIENPSEGDETRSWVPPAREGTATYYLAVNRNKASLAVDFRSERGQAIVRELAQRADIVVENYLTGTLARYGLDYPTLAALNPRLIYCSLSGYGRTGSLATRAGYDFVIQAESGLMSINGEPGGAPQKFGVAISDLLAGGYAVQAILAALFARERSGQGQLIDIALLDASVAVLSNVASASLNAGAKAKRYGNAHASIVPYQTFAAADATFVLACANNRQFRDLCLAVIDRPALPDDARFATNTLRVTNRDALSPLLAECFVSRSCADILAACKAANIPAGRVRTVEEVLASPEVAERNMIFETDGVRTTGSPMHFSATPVRTPSAPPALGEHSDTILRDVLGYNDAQLSELRAAKVIA